MTKINKITTFFVALTLGLIAQSSVAFAATTISSCNSVTLNGYVAPKNGPSTVWFEWSTNSSSISNGSATKTPTKSFSTNSYFSQQVTGLSESTTYYYRTAAKNVNSTIYGSVTSFTTASCNGEDPSNNDGDRPSVTTYSATEVSQSSATLKGYINPNGTSGSAYWFEWGTSSSNLSRSTSRVSISSSRDASSYISGLSSDTTYYFRIVGNNNAGTTNGSIKSFRTDSNGYYEEEDNSDVLATTKSATNIDYDSATLNGYIDTNGSSNVTRWFEWGRTSSNLSNTTSQSNISNGGNVSSYISGLSNNTTYYFRVVARGNNGTVYGSRYSFTTGSNGNCTNCYDDNNNDSVAPTAITMLATNVEGSSATLNSLVLQSGNVSSSAWFEWGTSQSLGRRTTTKNMGTAPSVRHAEYISGLTSGTTYYFRVVAENETGRNYGTINSFVAKSPVYIYNPAPTPVKKVITKKVVAPVAVQKTVTVVEHAEGVSSLVMLTITGEDDTITKGVGETYTVTWRNQSNQDLTNVVLRIIVPQSLTFESADDGTYSKADGIHTILIGKLNAGEEGEMNLVLKGSNTLNMNDLVVTTANIVYTDEYSIQGDALAYTTQRATSGTSVLGASVGTVGGISIALIGWLILIILIIILIIVCHNLYQRVTKKD